MPVPPLLSFAQRLPQSDRALVAVVLSLLFALPMTWIGACAGMVLRSDSQQARPRRSAVLEERRLS
jgi:hypothetical protein